MSGPPLWVVERPRSRAFLFGEALGLRDDEWLSADLRDAVEGSRELWREADREALASSALLVRYALANEPLSVLLDAGRLSRVHEVARSVGVDTVITGLAIAARLPVRYEMGDDAEATFSWFDGLGVDLEVDYLMWTVGRVAAGRRQVDRHVDAWQRGDLSVAEADDRAMRQSHPALHERMLAERNRAWVPRIEVMLGQPGTAFVLVGGAHLVGEASIQACLAGSGLRVVRTQ